METNIVRGSSKAGDALAVVAAAASRSRLAPAVCYRHSDSCAVNGCSLQSGFTMIELMMVMVILAVLMGIAIPTYTSFAAKARVSECLNAAAPMKFAISEVTINMANASFPADAAAAGLNLTDMASLDYCDSAQYAATGVLTLQVDEAAVGAIGTIEMLLVPNIVGTGTIDWDCQPGATSADAMHYLPADCRS